MVQPRAAADEIGIVADAGRHWDLCLYVTGQSPKSLRAIENLRRTCEKHLAGRCQIEIVDLLEDPRRAAADQILAVPTLVRRLPSPTRKLVGDLSDTEHLLAGLEIRPPDAGE
jgi:circadian clock protein KaiB